VAAGRAVLIAASELIAPLADEEAPLPSFEHETQISASAAQKNNKIPRLNNLDINNFILPPLG
jgi:hypothetical protein